VGGAAERADTLPLSHLYSYTVCTQWSSLAMKRDLSNWCRIFTLLHKKGKPDSVPHEKVSTHYLPHWGGGGGGTAMEQTFKNGERLTF
jgi:hypothetical protein